MENYNPRESSKSGWSFWNHLIQGFLGDITSNLTTQTEIFLQRQERKLKRSAGGFIMTALGILFLMYGVAVFINRILEIGEWEGFVAVGAGLLLIGLILKKRANH